MYKRYSFDDIHFVRIDREELVHRMARRKTKGVVYLEIPIPRNARENDPETNPLRHQIWNADGILTERLTKKEALALAFALINAASDL